MIRVCRFMPVKQKMLHPQTYVGLPNGLLVGDASGYGFTKTSKPGTYFLAPTPRR
jgi:hypothetical protein